MRDLRVKTMTPGQAIAAHALSHLLKIMVSGIASIPEL